MTDAGVGLESYGDVELHERLREARSAFEPGRAADRIPGAHDVRRIPVRGAHADQDAYALQRHRVERMQMVPLREAADAERIWLQARRHRVRAGREARERRDAFGMPEDEAVRLLRASREARDVDLRGKMPARLVH